MTTEGLIRIVDDDRDLRDSLAWTIQRAGYTCRVFASGDELLDELDPQVPGCILLDLCMPKLTGIEVQQELCQRGVTLPIVFMSAQAQVRDAVEALHGGAVDFLEKPASREDLLKCIDSAVTLDLKIRAMCQHDTEVIERMQRLTPREAEVFEHVVAGYLSKQIAARLDISPRTVEVHRAHIMQKLDCVSIAELVHLALEHKKALRRSASSPESETIPEIATNPSAGDPRSASPGPRSQD